MQLFPAHLSALSMTTDWTTRVPSILQHLGSYPLLCSPIWVLYPLPSSRCFLLMLFLPKALPDSFYPKWFLAIALRSTFLLFFLRKISPELTSMPIFLYFICGTPTTAWLAKQCHVRTQDSNQWTQGCQSGTCALNCCTTGLAPQLPSWH